jgi:hypothetical protein
MGLSCLLQSSLALQTLLCIQVFSYMDYVTRQFINLTKKFRKEFRHLADSLRKSIERQTDAIHEAKDAYYQSRDTAPILRTNLEIPHPIEVTTSPKDKKTGREWYKLVIETLTLLSVFAYFVVTARMWHEMILARHQTQKSVAIAEHSARIAEDALEESRDNFRKAERPYLALNLGMSAPVGVIPTPGNVGNWLNYNGTNAEWSIHFKNFGKSPAINVRANAKLECGPSAWRNVAWHKMGDSAGIMVPPEGDYWLTARSRDVSAPDYKVFHDSFAEIAVFGHIEYEGLDGTNYWTEYCFSHGHGGAIEMCPTHNLGN